LSCLGDSIGAVLEHFRSASTDVTCIITTGKAADASFDKFLGKHLAKFRPVFVHNLGFFVMMPIFAISFIFI